jgi:hypothetical protein
MLRTRLAFIQLCRMYFETICAFRVCGVRFRVSDYTFFLDFGEYRYSDGCKVEIKDTFIEDICPFLVAILVTLTAAQSLIKCARRAYFILFVIKISRGTYRENYRLLFLFQNHQMITFKVTRKN